MPEISPELAARIETLKASHAENPARFFMPLASAWREAGETAKAEELLRENLKRHPGYLSAHVLLGRCLADRGAYAEARNEFQYVLSVDPQNLIALRTLGDMAGQGGDSAEARRWYDELLHVDPMNAEARAAL
ncbi:MAG: tetratricopeptide repeat protein, partial [Gemmatimonadetes bacterium]|nr:tetratricopeptide repeat protein [Gemmatimonadota bacterium]